MNVPADTHTAPHRHVSGQSDNAGDQDAVLLQLAQRVDDAVRAAHRLEVGATRVALEMRTAVEAFHREGLMRLLRILRAHPATEDLLAQMGRDSFLQALFGLHGLIRPGLDERIASGLDRARPLLAQHGGDVEFVRREDDVVFVRLTGNCADCVLAPLTLREAVTDAVLKQAPEIKRIELLETQSPAKPIIEHPGEGWERGPDVADLEDGVLLRFDLSGSAGASVLLRRRAGEVKAWSNRCPHRNLALDGGLHDRCNSDAHLVCPWHGFAFDVDTGECTNNRTISPLIPVPLLERGGSLWLRP